jgi:hypothetical protein
MMTRATIIVAAIGICIAVGALVYLAMVPALP